MIAECLNPGAAPRDLRQLAEEFRARATRVEARHGKETWVQTLNVIAAFEQCAEALEAYVALETRPQEQVPAPPPLCALPPVPTANPS